MTLKCKYCGAFHWVEERTTGYGGGLGLLEFLEVAYRLVCTYWDIITHRSNTLLLPPLGLEGSLRQRDTSVQKELYVCSSELQYFTCVMEGFTYGVANWNLYKIAILFARYYGIFVRFSWPCFCILFSLYSYTQDFISCDLPFGYHDDRYVIWED